jgi:hypothetical protein
MPAFPTDQPRTCPAIFWEISLRVERTGQTDGAEFRGDAFVEHSALAVRNTAVEAALRG